jgi:anti-sigma B factor antagonist
VNGIFLITGVNQELEKIIEMSSLDESLNFVARLEEATDLIYMEEIEKDLRDGFEEED